MRSRLTTYMLVVAVLAVWGFVAWRIFFSRPAPPTIALHQPAGHNTFVAEEYCLSLDYDDPFLRDAAVIIKDEPSVRAQSSSQPELLPPSLPPDDLTLKYAGTISVGDTVSYIIEHAGLLHSLSPGETIESYTLVEAFTDSVRLAGQGMVFTLHRQP